MEENSIVKLNESLIVRDEDASLFSLAKMQVYNFNKVGFDLLKYIYASNVTVNDVKSRAQKLYNMTDNDTEAFIKKLYDNNLIYYSSI